MRNASKLFATLVLVVLFSSCATMFGGSKYNAHIEVEGRPKARIYVNDTKVDTDGSATVLQKRNESVYIEVRDGDCKVTKDYMNEMRVGWLLSDVFITGLIPAVVDFATGSIYKPVEGRGVQKLGTDDFKYRINIDEECPIKSEITAESSN